MDYLRVKMKGRETVIHYHVSKRDVKHKIGEHLLYFGRESFPSGKKDDLGRDIYELREVPPDIWEFAWVANAGAPDETVEPVTIG